jgi:hypothetical protein
VNEGKLLAVKKLVMSSEIKFELDSETATRPSYMQLVEDSSGMRMLTLLNSHNNSIYFFDYIKGTYIKKVTYEREGPNGILRLMGYYIKNVDSIYVYNGPMPEVDLTNTAGYVKKRTQLRGENPDGYLWSLYYPQYTLSAVIPFIEIDRKLILTGISPFSVRDSLIDRFRFVAYLDMETGQTEFKHTYPKELYGKDVNWNDPFYTQVYPELSPAGELILSFPISHDLYLTDLNKEDYRKVYAGSNVAGTIRSIDRDGEKETSAEVVLTHYLQEDLYTGIRHDPWRKVYYRFMLQGRPNAIFSDPIETKPVIVILLDEQFNYLGETRIGTGMEWNWANSFVTEEGLNIEYIDEDDVEESYLNFKIFTIEDL